VELSVRLARDNRYILRSACRYFTFVGEPERALHALSQSDAIRGDPWIQAAEVAVSDLCGKAPKWARRAIAAVVAAQRYELATSELALGLATLEHKAGGNRKLVRRLAESGLQKPTENALAQAVWLEGAANINVESGQVLLAHQEAAEALSMKCFEEGQYAECTRNAWRWVKDQPFSPRGYLLGSYCSSIQLHDHEEALSFCRAGLQIHPDHPMLLNGVVVAQTYLGHISQAEETFRRMLPFGNDQAVVPFIEAARGLLDYRQGRVASGRRHYLSAMSSARKAGDQALGLNAMIYMLEQEVMCGILDQENWASLKKSLNDKIGKLSKDRGYEVKRTWGARSKLIDQLLDAHPMFTSRCLGAPLISELKMPI
jgi:tetratricopeptide (TPR) repeat protein